MDWRDEGILLTVRRHGESAAIIDVFTAEHGRHAGVVRGGASRRVAPLLQPGSQLSVEWRARLEEHIGTYQFDVKQSRAAALMSNGDALAAMGSVASLLTAYVGEREAREGLFGATVALLDAICVRDDWIETYIGWELILMADLGFPLDLSRCAVTGAEDDLRWVSPKTGRAVSAAAGEPYADKLLPLPVFLGGTEGGAADGLRLTGHFLKTWVAPSFGGHAAPDARARFAERVERG